MIWLKIFILGVLWFAYYFILVLTAAFMGGSPGADVEKSLKISMMLSIVPAIIFYIYRIFKTYVMNVGSVFNLSDIYWILIPTVLVAISIYLSK